jgi:hypothetical protein
LALQPASGQADEPVCKAVKAVVRRTGIAGAKARDQVVEGWVLGHGLTPGRREGSWPLIMIRSAGPRKASNRTYWQKLHFFLSKSKVVSHVLPDGG